MKKFALVALASAAFALSACGSSDDASEDAIADNVEIPADEAMAGTPDPAEDAESAAGAVTDEAIVQTAESAGAAAAAVVADIQAAEAATQAAEEAID